METDLKALKKRRRELHVIALAARKERVRLMAEHSRWPKETQARWEAYISGKLPLEDAAKNKEWEQVNEAAMNAEGKTDWAWHQANLEYCAAFRKQNA